MVHEALDLPAHMPYHAARLRPMPVLEICGRTRDYQPKCQNEESVWAWWKDIYFHTIDSWIPTIAAFVLHCENFQIQVSMCFRLLVLVSTLWIAVLF